METKLAPEIIITGGSNLDRQRIAGALSDMDVEIHGAYPADGVGPLDTKCIRILSSEEKPRPSAPNPFVPQNDQAQQRLLSELKDYLESLPRRQVKQENGGQTESLLDADDVFGWVEERIKVLESPPCLSRDNADASTDDATWPEEECQLSKEFLRHADMSMEAGARAAAMSAKAAEKSMGDIKKDSEEEQNR